MNDMRGLIDLVEDVFSEQMAPFDELFFPSEDNATPLCEGWINGRFNRNIRIDSGSHLEGGDIHAHVFGRRKNQILAVKLDGSGSHGTKGKLDPADADALRRKGFKIRSDNIVEWFVIGSDSQILLG